MKATRKKTSKPYWEMNLEELRAATAEFDHGPLLEETMPLTRKDRELHALARKRGRPARGQGAMPIAVTIERGLLGRADRLAKRLKVTRARLIEMGLRSVLAKERTATRGKAAVSRAKARKRAA